MNRPTVDMQAHQERLDFIGMDGETRSALQSLKPAIAASIGPALDAFYKKAGGNPKSRGFFADAAQMASAKQRQEKHWAGISAAAFDESYVGAVTTVGQIHARLGLEPRWYIGGYSIILETLLTEIVKTQWPSRFGRTTGSTDMARKVAAIVKAALLDMDYGISAYLQSLEAHRQEAEARRAAAEEAQSRALEAFGQCFARLAAGDLTTRVETDLTGGFVEMGQNFNQALERLEETIGSVVSSTGSIRTGLSEINIASADLSQRTEQQAASLEETVAALAEVMRAVDTTAQSASDAQAAAGIARENAEKGGSVVSDAVAAMSQIERSSAEIGKIIGVIDEIAFQTNLLALNAGVEAARAGEAGRGFAVVAQEVRGLAQRSAEAAKEIKNLISVSSAQVGEGVELVTASGRALETITEQVGNVASVIAGIAGSAREQAISLREVSTAADQMDKVTQQNAAMVEETTAAAQALTLETEALAQMTGHFRVARSSDASRAAAPVAARRPPSPRAASLMPSPRPAIGQRGAASGAAMLRSAQSPDEWEEF